MDVLSRTAGVDLTLCIHTELRSFPQTEQSSLKSNACALSNSFHGQKLLSGARWKLDSSALCASSCQSSRRRKVGRRRAVRTLVAEAAVISAPDAGLPGLEEEEIARLGAQARVFDSEKPLSVVMKFGGSSVADSVRMKEVASLILSFSEEQPAIVLSAMGKTTNNLIQAGEKAITCGVGKCGEIEELKTIRELHYRTADELGVDRSVISALLEELSQLLTGVALIKELTPRTKDYLLSFGERMSTRIFAAYLCKLGAKAKQYDSFEIGFVTTDEFTNADLLDETYDAVAAHLESDWKKEAAIPIITGYIAKGQKTGAITTLGRGGSDLSAAAVGRALNLREIQVWKDVDGVLTCDPRIHQNAVPVPFLTFDEAAELAYFGAQVLHPQSMRPARDGNVPVRVKNSYNPEAAGTLITKDRDMSQALLTSIVCKSNITMLDIVSTRMLGQYGFLAKVFSTFEDLGISVDVVATSEVSISLTLDPAKMWSRELIQHELENMHGALRKIAYVKLLQGRSIISLIGNVERSSLVLEKAFTVFRRLGVNVQMISQGASKVNISLIVDDDEAQKCVRALHREFFETQNRL